MKRFALWAPLVIFALLFAVVASGLFRPADKVVRSAMVGKPLPDFALPAMVPGKPGLTSASFKGGQPRLLNVFASWCVPCIAEAPHLMRLKTMGIPIDAIAIRDTTPAIAGFLRRNGDPYARIGSDTASRVQLALGSSGVPETFVVDGRGIVVKQIIGDIREDNIGEIVQAVREAR
ncbi:Cytochrome c-type biogenesis protein CcmG/DsbE, thiol:disulfide oxidoreductase [Sphingomonas sp. T1]|uniref:redoxin family protein n=1 Tax=Sphingomonas sp. T1 TaxID=2653172 RepID=UPI0012F2184F|nr:redoxin family protein [Sphingomonas sp. T1]VXD05563.1 Cytochrome c-type biogenesis protein CcmG/DsbE, thiol:disulfide oxidoreductase [Sphingomonas sp. T1]